MSVIDNEFYYAQGGMGYKTLETIEEAVHYNNWLASKIKPYLGKKNIELGAGIGTIAAILSRDHALELYEIAVHNQDILKSRFKNSKNVLHIAGDVTHNTNWNQYDCVYSSNVLEHILNDEEIVLHCCRLLRAGGYFVAIVPAMKALYSDADKMIGHYRRYSKRDVARIVSFLGSNSLTVKVMRQSLFNPVGALGWFIKMRILHKKKIDRKDAMLMNSLVPFIKWMDTIPLGIGQSMIFVLQRC
ncbi:MAG: class I SAM-dependent methyltransferase [Patescibacteria group bacterium]|nr:class I SAM-dependent methyltransferase [Patescibacteria group bacterium]